MLKYRISLYERILHERGMCGVGVGSGCRLAFRMHLLIGSQWG